MARHHARHPHDWLLLVLAFSALAMAILFVTVGANVIGGILEPVNQSVRRWVMEDRKPLLIHLYTAISFVGDKTPLTILCVAAGWFLIPGKRWWVPLVVLCALGTMVLVDWLKATYAVVRPETGLLTSKSHSFPSGHTSGTAAIAFFFAYVAIRNNVKPFAFAAGALLLTVLVGVSRVYLDEHWSSDVVGGWVVGAAIAAAFSAVYEWLLRHQRTTYPTRS